MSLSSISTTPTLTPRESMVQTPQKSRPASPSISVRGSTLKKASTLSRVASFSPGSSPRRKYSIEQNICDLKMATQLLKFGKNGKGFRYFQLTPTLDGITWHSKNKSAAKTKFLFKDVKEIVFGQRTEKFRRNNRPDLDHLSFSLIPIKNEVEESLDLVCKDETEFQLWTKTLQALVDGTVPAEVIERLKSQAATETKSELLKRAGGFKRQDIFQGANDAYGFGWGEWGQNGYGEPKNTTTPLLLEALLGKNAVQIACGWSHTTVLLENGALMQGGNHVGTGLSDDYAAPIPLKLSPEKFNIVQIACGSFHTMALSDRGQVLSWGCNLNGQLGHGDQQDVKDPKVIEVFSATSSTEEIFIEDIACGAHHSAALAADGKVYTWGCNDHGVLGNNDSKEDQLVPQVVKDLIGIDIVLIACGSYHMIACTKSETYAWGWNGCGQLGLGHEEDQQRPIEVDALRGNQVEDVACGAAHTVAVVFMNKFKTKIVYSWGSNANGQLGQGKKKRVLKPLPVPDLKDIQIDEVACGSMHTVLRSEEGEIFSSGLNKHGQLGHGNTNNLDGFKVVEALKGKESRRLACGGESTCVLTARTWVEDREAKECMSCKVAFTFVNRKHHCRNCGGIFCSNCSSKKIAILKYGLTEPVRVCASCYVKLGGR